MPVSPHSRQIPGLMAAYAVSTYGNYLNLIALSLFTYEVTGSPLGIGVLMTLRLAAGALMGLGAGALATRLNRRKLMICTDISQALAMTVLALNTESAAVPLLGGVIVVLGAGNTLFTVALRSAVPEMVGHQERVRANGLLVTARSFAMVLGFASAGLIVSAGGYRTAFVINAGSFLVSAAALASIRLRTNASGSRETETRVSSTGAWLRSLTPLLLGMVLLRGADALGSSSHNVALPVMANLMNPASPAAFMSRFWAAWAVGGLLAHQVVTRWWKRRNAPLGERAFAVGTCLMSVSFVVAFTQLPAPLLILVALVAGLADGYTEIAYTSRLQAVPDERRGRLFGLSAVAETSGFAVGMVTSAAALEALPALAVVGLFHGMALCGAAGFLLLVAITHRTTGTNQTQGENEHGAGTATGPVPGTRTGVDRG